MPREKSETSLSADSPSQRNFNPSTPPSPRKNNSTLTSKPDKENVSSLRKSNLKSSVASHGSLGRQASRADLTHSRRESLRKSESRIISRESLRRQWVQNNHSDLKKPNSETVSLQLTKSRKSSNEDSPLANFQENLNKLRGSIRKSFDTQHKENSDSLPLKKSQSAASKIEDENPNDSGSTARTSDATGKSSIASKTSVSTPEETSGSSDKISDKDSATPPKNSGAGSNNQFKGSSAKKTPRRERDSAKNLNNKTTENTPSKASAKNTPNKTAKNTPTEVSGKKTHSKTIRQKTPSRSSSRNKSGRNSSESSSTSTSAEKTPASMAAVNQHDTEPIILELGPQNIFDVYYDRIFGDVTKKSAAKQFIIGGATGWLSGFLAIKVGKIAAVSITGAAILVQVAQHHGIININWTKLDRVITKARARARAALQKQHSSIFDRTNLFYEENFFLATGFASGFLFAILV